MDDGFWNAQLVRYATDRDSTSKRCAHHSLLVCIEECERKGKKTIGAFVHSINARNRKDVTVQYTKNLLNINYTGCLSWMHRTRFSKGCSPNRRRHTNSIRWVPRGEAC